jgi:hypothetical protein
MQCYSILNNLERPRARYRASFVKTSSETVTVSAKNRYKHATAAAVAWLKWTLRR